MTTDIPKVIGTMAFDDDSVIDIHEIEFVDDFVKLTRYGQDGKSFIIQVRKDIFEKMFVEEE